MQKVRNSMISKVAALVLSAAIVVGMLPNTSYADILATPDYGTVSVVTDGIAVKGEADSNDVQIEQTGAVVLEWAAIDASLGRNKEGWWAGVKITAPSGLTQSDLENASVQKKEQGASEWTGDVKFWDAKDSADDALEHFVNVWAHIDETKLAETSFVQQWQFDWNGDASYDQTVTLTLDPKQIVLIKDDVQVYPALGTVEALSDTAATISGSATGYVQVVSEKLSLDWFAKNEAIGRNRDGWWAGVKLTAPSGMTQAELEKANIQKKEYGSDEWTGKVDFWSAKDSADADTVHHTGMWVYLTPAILRNAEEADEDVVHQWRVDWNGDGEYEQVIQYTIVLSDKIVLNKVDQEVLEFDALPEKLTYSTELYQIKVNGGSGSGKVSYEITSGTDVAEVDASGKLTVKQAGTFTIKTVKAGDDTYKAGVAITKTVVVEPADQTGFTFADDNVEVTFNDNENKYTQVATGGQSSKDVEYTIEDLDGTGVAEIDKATGVVTIKKAGKVKITATRPADNKYKVATAEYILTIEKATQKIVFENGEAITLDYGEQTYVNTAKEEGKAGTAAIVYAISGTNELEADIDASNGLLTLKKGKVGTITVKATKAEDECYEACAAEYTFTVKYLAIPSTQCTLVGDISNGWYTSDIKIKAPEGYYISYSNDLTGNVWEREVTYTTEGKTSATVYLRNEQGGITDAITIADIQLDKTLPKDLSISYDTPTWTKILEKLTFGYYVYDGEVTVTLKATDDVSGIVSFEYTYKNKNEKVTVAKENLTYNEKTASYEFKLAPQYRDTIVFKAIDVAGNETKITDKDETTGYEKVVVLDNTNPAIEVEYTLKEGKEEETTGIIYAKDDVTAKFAITESNFDLSEAPVVKVNGEEKAVTWTEEDGKYVAEYTLSGENDYLLTVNFTDVAGKAMSSYEREIHIDATAPVIDITYDNNDVKNGKYYNKPRTATIQITEHNFSAEKVVATVVPTRILDASAVIEDYAAYLKKADSWKEVAADVYEAKITFKEDADYTFSVEVTDLCANTATKTEADFVIDNTDPVITAEFVADTAYNSKYYQATRVLQITVNEHNFDVKDIVPTIDVSRVLDGKTPVDYAAYLKDSNNWTSVEDEHTIEISFTDDADYIFALDYTDLSGREAVQYEAEDYVIDTVNPVIAVTYDNNNVANGKYYKAPRTATITVTEHNFSAADVVATVTAMNKLDENAVIEHYAEYLKKVDSWTSVGDVHTATITFKEDADYTFALDCTDLADRKAVQYVAEPMVIDNVDPVIAVTYDNNNVANGKYYKAPRTATIAITEHNFRAADVVAVVTATNKLKEDAAITDYAEYLKKAGSWTSVGDVHTATITFKEDAEYAFTLDYTDLADRKAKQYEAEPMVIDNVDPVIAVTYDNNDVANGKYYKAPRTATITITEHNFKEVGDEEVRVVAVVTPSNKLEENVIIEDYAEYLKKADSWTSEGDVHTATITFKEDAEYAFTLDYTDLADRKAKQYEAESMVIDNVDPTVSVVYDNVDVVETIDGREYYNAKQSATITVDEHNFRASDVDVLVDSLDVTGATIKNAVDYKALLQEDSNWTHNGDIHTATISFAKDANYTFDVEMEDLAARANEEYKQDLFTVDTKAPKNLKIEYSTTVDEKKGSVLYYDAKMIVTISAQDDTSGIHSFLYSYVKSEGVSKVNADLLDEAIKSAKITRDGKTFTAQFAIPKSALTKKNQFNGTIEFVAYDISANSSDKQGKTKVVVDNIKPTIDVTLNKPVKDVNGQSFYDGDIHVDFVIKEANFFAKDVDVIVTRDGRNQNVKVKWEDKNVDVHNGSFTLTEDGDYKITIRYVDRSTNEMKEYVSNALTIDTKHPTVSVSKIKMNSANKDKTYGFTITANDINLDAGTFKPVLKAVIRNKDGKYETKTLPLGKAKAVKAGETYAYTVKNLEDDGIYTLTCELKDYANNSYSKLGLQDKKEYETVQFSINRDGSTFRMNDATKAVVDQYYVYSVDKDVVIEEINTDPINTYRVTVNGRVLGKEEYSTTLSNKKDEWSKRVYTVPKELFAEEGEYNVVVESTDKAKTTVYSDIKDLKIAFVVDQTKPVVTVSGLVKGGRYQTENHTVTIVPTDDGGKLYSVKAILYSRSGKTLKEESWEGESLFAELEAEGGKLTFEIPDIIEDEEIRQSIVKIICNDCATQSTGVSNVEELTFERITVSPSSFVMFWENLVARYSAIAGVVLLLGLIIFLIFMKNRKKEETK